MPLGKGLNFSLHPVPHPVTEDDERIVKRTQWHGALGKNGLWRCSHPNSQSLWMPCNKKDCPDGIKNLPTGRLSRGTKESAMESQESPEEGGRRVKVRVCWGKQGVPGQEMKAAAGSWRAQSLPWSLQKNAVMPTPWLQSHKPILDFWFPDFFCGARNQIQCLSYTVQLSYMISFINIIIIETKSQYVALAGLALSI